MGGDCGGVHERLSGDGPHWNDVCWPARSNVEMLLSSLCTILTSIKCLLLSSIQTSHDSNSQWVQPALPCESEQSDVCAPHDHRGRRECVRDFPVQSECVTVYKELSVVCMV